MKRLILSLSLLLLLGACSTLGSVSNTPSPGPSVLGKEKGSEAQVWIPFADVAGDTKPTIATEAYVKAVTPTVSGFFGVPVQSASKTLPQLTAAMYVTGTGHTDAPKTIAASQYLSVGGREYGKGSYRMIGFGYRGNIQGTSPVAIGSQETDPNDQTEANFLVAVRPDTKSAPVSRFEVHADGQILATAGYSPSSALSLTDKAYVDGHVLATTRPASPVVGQQYFDKTHNRPEVYDGAKWVYTDGTPAP